MKQPKFNVMLHPVRMKIIQTLIGDKTLTAGQISELLPDIPPATMYRHINKLLDADILKVTDENRIRGTVEKVYALAVSPSKVAGEDLKNASNDEHFKYFFTFLLNLLGEYETYLNKENSNVLEDGVSYKQAGIYLSDEEYEKVSQSIQKVLFEVLDNKPAKDRRLRTFTTIVIPQPKRKESKNEKNN